jgi:uncharacterized protein (TIGR02147 family)
MVIQRKRLPSADMVQRLSSALRHSELEHLYFEKLVALEAARRQGADTREAEQALRAINPNALETHSIPLDAFAAMSHWYFYVVKQLIAAPGFREDYAWIRKRLRGKVSTVEIRTALRVLQELGMVTKDPQSGAWQVAQPRLSTPRPTMHSLELQEHHRQMAMRAAEALGEQAPGDREFNGLTLRVNPAQLPEIKDWLRQIMRQFDQKFEDTASTRIFQLNLQFFEHTQSEPRGTP